MGVPLHPGFITDDDGTVIEEEVHAGETYLQAPFGGTRENGSHKGYGMGVVADLFFNGLSTQAEDEPDERGRLTAGGGFFAAFDIEHFTDREQYDRAADGLLADLRNTKPAPGFERVLYPGLRGAEITAERRANGIPYHPEVIVWFHRAAAELGEEVVAAVSKFPPHSGKCSPEDEQRWRSEPVFAAATAQARL